MFSKQQIDKIAEVLRQHIVPDGSDTMDCDGIIDTFTMMFMEDNSFFDPGRFYDNVIQLGD